MLQVDALLRSVGFEIYQLGKWVGYGPLQRMNIFFLGPIRKVTVDGRQFYLVGMRTTSARIQGI